MEKRMILRRFFIIAIVSMVFLIFTPSKAEASVEGFASFDNMFENVTGNAQLIDTEVVINGATKTVTKTYTYKQSVTHQPYQKATVSFTAKKAFEGYVGDLQSVKLSSKPSGCRAQCSVNGAVGKVFAPACPNTHKVTFVGTYKVTKKVYVADKDDDSDTDTTPTQPTQPTQPTEPAKPADTTPPDCTITPVIGTTPITGNTKETPSNNGETTFLIKFTENVTQPSLAWSKKEVNDNRIANDVDYDLNYWGGSGNTYQITFKSHENMDYKLYLQVNPDSCTDAAGNKNLFRATEFYIDTKKPEVRDIVTTVEEPDGYEVNPSNIFKTINGKTSKLSTEFKVRDYHYDLTDILTVNDLIVTVGGKEVAKDKLTLESKKVEAEYGQERGYDYKLTINEFVDQNGAPIGGKIDIKLPEGKIIDVSGNGNVETSLLNTTQYPAYYADNVKPQVKVAKISGGNEYGYVKNGGAVILDVEFSEILVKAPTIKIGGRNTQILGSDNQYRAILDISSGESTLKEGEISIEVNYKDLANFEGETLTKTTDGSKVIYDRTAPVVSSIDPDGNIKWAKNQGMVVTVTDNYTPKNKIVGKYGWLSQNQTTPTSTENLVNEAKIAKDKVTGKYRLYIEATDLAGNKSTAVSKEFYIDNKLTKVGSLSITKGSYQGEQYTMQEKTTADGIVYEGNTSEKNLYIRKNDGSDSESGHKTTEYKIEKIENGKTTLVEKAKTGNTIITKNGDYKITLTTKDNAGNLGTRVYIIHKQGNSDTNDEEEDNILLGDLNGDKVVDIIDLSILQQRIIGKLQLEEKFELAADLNQDGTVDIIDLSLMIQIIIG